MRPRAVRSDTSSSSATGVGCARPELAFDGIRFLPGQHRSALFEGLRAAPFADAVPVPDYTPLIGRLVAWNGRRPC